MQFHPSDFTPNDAWLILRLDAQIKDQPLGVYMVMDLPSTMILTIDAIENKLSQKQADKLLKEAKVKNGGKPKRIILAKGDPAEQVLFKSAKKININFESVPSSCIEGLTAELKEVFYRKYSSQSAPLNLDSNLNFDSNIDSDALDPECTERMIPDDYDLCSCASGKKYKFCCKRIFAEIIEAMVATEDGNYTEALIWIEKAKAAIGETSELLCREAIIYSYFNTEQSGKLLSQCLSINPNHPRAHYIHGLTLQESGDFHGAIAAYENAISNYPETDHYHLNETYNNLGVTFYTMGDLIKAKDAWEKALLFFPSDKIARNNLTNFIYDPLG